MSEPRGANAETRCHHCHKPARYRDLLQTVRGPMCVCCALGECVRYVLDPRRDEEEHRAWVAASTPVNGRA